MVDLLDLFLQFFNKPIDVPLRVGFVSADRVGDVVLITRGVPHPVGSFKFVSLAVSRLEHLDLLWDLNAILPTLSTSAASALLLASLSTVLMGMEVE
jgi:hypothetical protein